jgi:hypothetical protein
MSGLVYQGDAVKGLGQFIPSLIIEKVYILDDKLSVRAAVYLPVIDSPTNPTPALAEISTLNFYGALVIDEKNIEAVINREANILSQIMNLATVVYEDSNTASGNMGVTNFSAVTPDFSVSTANPELVYDLNENPIYKYFVEFDIALNIATQTTAYTDVIWDEYFADKLGANTNISLFCFATPYELSNRTSWKSDYTTFTKTSDYTPASSTTPDPGHQSYLPRAPLALIERNIGDITYESIFVNGRADVTPKIAYVDEEGVYYDETPLMALNAKYYKPIFITHEEIVDKFNDILSEFQPDRETEIELAGVVDSISYALSVYGEKADILQQLNTIRKAFPKRGGATRTGRLYDKYAVAISAVNDKIKQGAVLTKTFYRNSKIIDSRGTPTISYTQSAPTITDSEVLYEDALISRAVYKAELGDGSNPAQALNWGYFFCDFEKVLHKDSQLAQLLETKKVDKLFGHQLLNTACKIKDIELVKRERATKVTTPYPGRQVKMTIDYDSELPFDERTWPGESARLEYDTYQSTAAYQQLVATPGIDGGTDYSSCNLRAFTPASTTGLYSSELGHDYRIMCFEFQDYYEVLFAGGDESQMSGPIGGYYEVEAQFTDRTLQILQYLKEHLQTVIDEFTAYEQAASDYCNYNNIDGYFNQFFIDYAKGIYTTSGEEPWVVASAAYYIYLDLLDETSNRTVQELADLAANLATKLSPTSGTLEEIVQMSTNLASLQTQLAQIDFAGADPTSHTYGIIYATGKTLTYTAHIDLETVPVAIADLQVDTATTTPCADNWEINDGENPAAFGAIMAAMGSRSSDPGEVGAILQTFPGWENWTPPENAVLDVGTNTQDEVYDRIVDWIVAHDQNAEVKAQTMGPHNNPDKYKDSYAGVSTVHDGFIVGSGKRLATASGSEWATEYIRVFIDENRGYAFLQQVLWTGAGGQVSPDDDCHLPGAGDNKDVPFPVTSGGWNVGENTEDWYTGPSGHTNNYVE